MRGAVITGWGTALPDKTVTNHDLALRMDTSHEWIVERTGIHERRVGGTTSSLAIEACQAALARAGVAGPDVQSLLLATTTPERTVPGTSPLVQHALGFRGGAVDVNGACSGFVYALVMAHGLVAQGLDRVLVAGSETLSRITDWDDRNTAVLFADGAGAVLLEAVDGPGQLLSWDLDSDGSLTPILYADIGGTFRMQGREVFRQAVRVMVDSAQRSMERAGVGPDDITLMVAHQANIRIIDAACQRLGIPVERNSVVIDRTGNTSAASIPIALASALDQGRVRDGDLVLLIGFGAGMTSASAVLRWGSKPG